MKAAKTPQAEAGPSNRRAQPLRQTRTNPPRTNPPATRNLHGRDSLRGGQTQDQPIDIFPAITHFTDAITALPNDLVRHFTLLKEVDAKIFAPEEALFQLVDLALKSNPPDHKPTYDGSSSVAQASTPMSIQDSYNGNVGGAGPASSSVNGSVTSNVFDSSNVPRRNLFFQTALKIQEMLVSLEEKNHVLATANDALSKQLGRINEVWPHLENEFSDEAKWGSTTHWAYPENRISRATQAERSRRDGAAYITAAAQQLQVEEAAAARSDARKQALIAKKGLKNQPHQDSDADDHDNNNNNNTNNNSISTSTSNNNNNNNNHNNKQKPEPTKKASGGAKARKAAAAGAEATTTPVGLGISTAANVNGNPPAKRRKVENKDKEAKAVNGGIPTERAMSSVFGNGAPKTKTVSPRATPAPAEPTKKRKALPTANGMSKKSKTATAPAAPSPSMPSPAAQPNPTDKPSSQPPPAPAVPVPRPASSRARGNSIASNADNGRQRPASSASNKLNGFPAVAPETTTTPNGPRALVEPKPPKEPAPMIKTESTKDDSSAVVPTAPNGTNKKESAPKPDEPEAKAEATTNHTQTTTTVVTTKSGRASKPSTPALGSFPDPAPRSRAARNSTAGTGKRSHKKGASQHTIPLRIAPDEEPHSNGRGDDENEVDADEPLYCYCNGVSYGEMVACDADDCPREWFHLDCVGLKAAPPDNMTWYCDNCKDRIKTGKKAKPS
ncbi:hypothetical protein GGR57DRAFT_84047 [Xylariaceae sp. FL1272]|nr:hypothetical protein GGR57DRAFT_84047 [Xylariaceae sp. FL1272]